MLYIHSSDEHIPTPMMDEFIHEAVCCRGAVRLPPVTYCSGCVRRCGVRGASLNDTHITNIDKHQCRRHASQPHSGSKLTLWQRWAFPANSATSAVAVLRADSARDASENRSASCDAACSCCRTLAEQTAAPANDACRSCCSWSDTVATPTSADGCSRWPHDAID